MEEQVDRLKIGRVLETSKALSLAQQDNAKLAVNVAYTAFQGENLQEVERDSLLRVIADVIGDMNADPSEKTIVQKPAKLLEYWITASNPAWFGTRKGDLGDIYISLLPHAREFLTLLDNEGSHKEGHGKSSLTDFTGFLEDSESRLTGDPESRRRHLQNIIDRAQSDIEKLDRYGMEPVDGMERRVIARKLRQHLGDMIDAISVVPDRLKQMNRRYGEWLQTRQEDSEGKLIADIMDEIKAFQDNSGGLHLSRSLADTQIDPHEEARLKMQIEVILRECGEFFTEEDRTRIASFFPSLVGLAQNITSKEAKMAARYNQILKRDDFGDIQARMLAVRDLQQAMVELRDELRPTIRDKRLEGLGFQMPHVTAPQLYRAMAEHMPEKKEKPQIAEAIVEDTDALEEGRRQRDRSRERASRIELGMLTDRINGFLETRQNISLAEILDQHPPLEGAVEVLAYQELASSRLPSRVAADEALSIEVVINGDDRMHDLVCPNFVFTREGPKATIT